MLVSSLKKTVSMPRLWMATCQLSALDTTARSFLTLLPTPIFTASYWLFAAPMMPVEPFLILVLHFLVTLCYLSTILVLSALPVP